ncbi:MAG: DNA-processing protein DprA [Betaproteobacteria bacterium]|jgi:DNA processing protein|nr:MAG: DNA-processing protein DprA [Betaproteobacteria bacterium]
MPDAELEAWLRLGLIPQLGPVAFRKLLSSFGSPEAALSASATALANVVGASLAAAIAAGPDTDLFAATLDWTDQDNNRLMTLADGDYPGKLLEISDPPPLLYLKGQPSLLEPEAVAIVGSRNATPQGIANAQAFARELSNDGFGIVSGLALGIDAAAHRGGLQGPGSSIAVVATGLDTVYPARNRKLAHELAQQGLLVSEFALGTHPVAGNFPRRNRLISGLSLGVLVVEAAVKSGSLITARYAIEQGREVFAIPGSVHSPVSKGCHVLIKQGAKLVDTSADIIEEFGRTTSKVDFVTTHSPHSKHPELLSAIGFDPVDLDTICARCGLTAQNASAMLLELELEGAVVRIAGGRFQQVRHP